MKSIIEAYEQMVSQVKPLLTGSSDKDGCHSIAKAVAKSLGTKLKNYRQETYKNGGGKIQGLFSYSFHDEPTHEAVMDALASNGFKSPNTKVIGRDADAMTSWSGTSVSPTHTAVTRSEQGDGLRLHIQDRSST